jgi:uncharacterized membrane protein YdjX (TVP38/TMEM64 family)
MSIAEDARRVRKGVPWRTLLGLGLILLAIAAGFLLPLRQYLTEVLDRVRGLGPWGPLSFVFIYAAATVLFFPGLILTLGAGFAFGLLRGLIAACAGSLLGVTAAFFLGRTLARGWVERKVAANPRFRAIDEAVGREGFKIVLLTRLSPAFPFNVLNYAFGVTQVSFRDYFLGSWLGMFPGTILYVYLGTLAGSLADLASGKVEGGALRYVPLGIGLLATVAVTVILTRIARSALRRAIPADSGRAFSPPPR